MKKINRCNAGHGPGLGSIAQSHQDTTKKKTEKNRLIRKDAPRIGDTLKRDSLSAIPQGKHSICLTCTNSLPDLRQG